MAYATNEADYILSYSQGLYESANGPYAAGRMGALTDSGYPAYDLDKAKAAVAAYTADTGQPLAFEFLGASTVDDASRAQLLKGMWEAAGMKITLRAVPQADQLVNTVLGKYQASDWRLFNQTDPDTDWVWLSSATMGKIGQISLNSPRYTSAEVDAGLNGGRSTADVAQRTADYEKVTRAVNAGLAYIWLARPDWVIGANPRVHGYSEALNGTLQTLGPKTWVGQLWVS
jgi:peptide/nickel transport system substrate-binding protein